MATPTPPNALVNEPLFRIGDQLLDGVNTLLAQAVLLLDALMANPTQSLSAIAVLGLGCALMFWLVVTVFSRLSRPRRAVPAAAAPAVASQVVLHTGRGGARRPIPRPRRRARKRRQNPFLRWLGVR